MNTFWLKIAGVVVVIAGIFIVINVLSPTKDREQAEKSYYDVIAEDDERLRAKPEPAEVQQERQTSRQPPEVKEEPLEFAELSIEDQVQAERLFEVALMERKKGRLPGMGYKNMVDYCREIIDKYPNSVYAYKAAKMLSEVPERFRSRYHMTEDEINP